MLKFKNIRTDYISEVTELKKLTKPISNSIYNLRNYRPIVSIQVTPHYTFNLGYYNSGKSNYTIIMTLNNNLNNVQIMPLKNETYDNLFKSLRKAMHTQPNGSQQLAEDILYIYERTNPLNYKYPDKIKPNPQLIKEIIQLSINYPERDCMDFWLEWLYLAMISEFLPKIRNNHFINSKLGKRITLIGLFQCIFTNMNPTEIKKYSIGRTASSLLRESQQDLKRLKQYVYSHPKIA